MYLKYARMNLQEAETALQEEHLQRSMNKVSDTLTALTKAVAAALPMVKKDFFQMSDRELAGHLSDLARKEDTSAQIVALLSRARHACREKSPARQHAEAALSAAGQAFSLLHDLFT